MIRLKKFKGFILDGYMLLPCISLQSYIYFSCRSGQTIPTELTSSQSSHLVGPSSRASNSVVAVRVCGMEVENENKLPPFSYDDFVALRLQG